MIQKFMGLTRPMRLMILALIIVFGGLVLFNVAKKILMQRFFENFERPAVTVSSVTVGQTDWKPSLHAVGSFLAINGVDINSEASGNVVAILFESGQTVEKDTPLIKIDDAIDQATLKSNRANLAFQTINYKRQAQLLKRNATSQSEVDAAKSQMLEAEAAVETTEVNIKHKHIKTPFAGRLGIRMVNLGEYVMPGKTNIVTLQSLDPLYLEFFLPEQHLSELSAGQNILFSLDTSPNKVFSGKITAINAKVDAKTHNVKVHATVPNCPVEVFNETRRSHLFEAKKIEDSTRTLITCDTEKNNAAHLKNYAFIPGMFASIEIEQPAIPNTLVLPSTAIAYSLYGNSVFLINPKKEGDTIVKNEAGQEIFTVRRVFVTTGDEQGNQVRITKGLQAGQTVVSAGEVKLQNDTPVVINNEVPINTGQTPQALSE